jgi:hypothetical protein
VIGALGLRGFDYDYDYDYELVVVIVIGRGGSGRSITITNWLLSRNRWWLEYSEDRGEDPCVGGLVQ